MRKIAFGGVVAAMLAATGIASAADLGRRPAPVYKAPPPAAFSWTGCYVGGNAGGIFNNSDVTANPNLDTGFSIPGNTTSYSFDSTDFTAGANWGCNWGHWGGVVVGLDSDFNWSGISESVTAGVVSADRGAYTQTITQDLDWFSTTRLRLGWAFADRWMLFAAGGLASGKVKSSYFDTDGLLSYAGSTSKVRYGWTVGGGLEYALTNNWFLRGEYMYIDLGDHNYASLNNGVAPGGTWNTDIDTKAHVVRGALTYRFTTAPSLWHWATGGFRY